MVLPDGFGSQWDRVSAIHAAFRPRGGRGGGGGGASGHRPNNKRWVSALDHQMPGCFTPAIHTTDKGSTCTLSYRKGQYILTLVNLSTTMTTLTMTMATTMRVRVRAPPRKSPRGADTASVPLYVVGLCLVATPAYLANTISQGAGTSAWAAARRAKKAEKAEAVVISGDEEEEERGESPSQQRETLRPRRCPSRCCPRPAAADAAAAGPASTLPE